MREIERKPPPEKPKNRMRQAWIKFWERIGAKGDVSITYDDLHKRHSESHRAYHTLDHVEQCLKEFETVRHLAKNPNAVEMAIWYHDAIYDIGASDNEERSADLARKTIQNTQLPEAFGTQVADLILTKHDKPQTDPDVQLLMDIDLSTFGQSEEIFDMYDEQIRDEYKEIPYDKYVEGRTTILKSFLERPHIYSTSVFREKYEDQARRNIKRLLDRLSMKK